jgi:hypothetical protein
MEQSDREIFVDSKISRNVRKEDATNAKKKT